MYRVTKPIPLRRRAAEKNVPKQGDLSWHVSIPQDLPSPVIIANPGTPSTPSIASEATQEVNERGKWTKGMRNVKNAAADAEARLRQFDLNPRFGPYQGMSRLTRWRRAAKFGLNPPPELLTIILDKTEQTLRTFDLNPRYGPFVGVDRLERWKRAEELGLNPPEAIKHILEELCSGS